MEPSARKVCHKVFLHFYQTVKTHPKFTNISVYRLYLDRHLQKVYFLFCFELLNAGMHFILGLSACVAFLTSRAAAIITNTVLGSITLILIAQKQNDEHSTNT